MNGNEHNNEAAKIELRQRNPRDVLQDLADFVREIYTEERRNFEQLATGRPSSWTPDYWDGVTGRRGDRKVTRKPTWPAIAAAIIRHRVNPELFVRSQFQYLRPHELPPHPNQLAGEKAFSRYFGSNPAARLAEEIQSAFRFEQATLRTASVLYNARKGWTPDERRKSLLTNETLGLSPLMRYCLACSEGLHGIAAHYEERAMMQFMRAPATYERIWKDWLPKDFATAAENYRLAILQVLPAPPRKSGLPDDDDSQ